MSLPCPVDSGCLDVAKVGSRVNVSGMCSSHPAVVDALAEGDNLIATGGRLLPTRGLRCRSAHV